MTYEQARQRVADARRAHHAAMDAREANHNPQTAAAVAIAQLRFEEAQRALARQEWL